MNALDRPDTSINAPSLLHHNFALYIDPLQYCHLSIWLLAKPDSRTVDTIIQQFQLLIASEEWLRNKVSKYRMHDIVTRT